MKENSKQVVSSDNFLNSWTACEYLDEVSDECKECYYLAGKDNWKIEYPALSCTEFVTDVILISVSVI